MTPEDFKGSTKRLDALDLPKIGRTIGVGEDEIRAILEVESRGAGFDRQGRPAMLFEPHVFWKQLGPGRKRKAAARAGLAYPKWGAKPYAKDSYPRLKQAMMIDEAAALRSASWGLGQVMGFNHEAAGWSSVQAMVSDMADDEEHQLAGMVKFIKASRLDDEIRRHDWAGFARGYNGAGFAKNRYDKRLATAFAKWQKIKDAPFSIELAADEDEANAPKPAPEASFVDLARVKAVQERLDALGYHMVGKPDGKAGPRTAAAISAFQHENDLPITGAIDDALIAQLETAEPHEPSIERQTGEPEASRIVAGGNAVKAAGAGVTLTGAVGILEPVLDQVETVKGIAGRVKDLVSPVKMLFVEFWPVILLVGGAVLLWHGIKIVRARIEDHRAGKTQ